MTVIRLRKVTYIKLRSTHADSHMVVDGGCLLFHIFEEINALQLLLQLTATFDSGHQHVPDLAIYFLNGLSYDKIFTVNVIELGKMHLSVLDTLS
jgi:hypothetical protein